MGQKKRILVTGGAGFLGAHLCRKLLEHSHEVLCLDNFFTGRKQNIVNLMSNPFFEVIRHDMCNPISVEVDEIYNLACPASPVHYQHDPVQTTKTSVLGALNVLNLANRLKVPVLQASTSEVYGDPHIHPQPESYWGNVNPIGPRACYDEGKRCAETLFMDFHRQFNLDIKIARIFNTYGPFMNIHDGRVISNFVVQALLDQDITLYGNGEQTRSFCFVDDTINGLIRLMESREVHTPVNIGNPHEKTMIDIAHKIMDITQSNSKLSYKPLPQDDPMQRCPDIQKAQSVLKFEPRIDLETGLRHTVAYFASELNLEKKIEPLRSAHCMDH